MEFEDTSGAGDEAEDSDADESQESGGAWERTRSNESHELGAQLESAFGVHRGRGLETRRQKAMIAAALFDEPVTPVKIGRFTIVRELGVGGMGVVYVAYDEQLDRRVAVKLLRGADDSAQAQFRLEREAQAMARLQHPNVVTVHEVGTFEGQVFVAMEFVDGQDLRGWLTSRSRSWRAIVEVFAQAGEGLAAAHEAGIVHRDFKPDNVLVGKDGRVRVADFGLAHAFDAPLEGAEANASESASKRLETSLTRTGAVMGTPAYMPPEQHAGRRTDARSDQFSFCVALWEGLYGRRPFVGRTLPELSLAIAEGRIEAPPEDSEVPAWLGALVSRGLSPEPDERWLTMRELLDAIGRDPGARRRRLLVGLGVGGMALALVGGLSGLAVSELRHNARQRYWNELTGQLLDIERERGLRQANDDAARARDATRMSVYRRYRPAAGVVDHEDPTVAAALLREVEGKLRQTSGWVSAANETLGHPISRLILTGHRDGVSSLVFAPDGAWLYSASFDGEVRRWELSSGRGEAIFVHGKHVTALALSRDGRLLASSSHDGTVRLWSVESPDEARVVARHDHPVMDVAFDPSARWLVSASKDHTAQLHDLQGGRVIVLEGHTGPVFSASFDGEGARVLTTSGDESAKLWRREDGAELGSLVGHEAAVFHGHILDDERVLTGSDDGTIRLHHLDADGVTSEIIARHEEPVTALDVRGEQVLSAATDGSVVVSSLLPTGGSTSIALPRHAQATWAAVFTPDGEQVASASFDGTARLGRADGRGVPRVFTGHRLSLFRVAVDEGGRWMATGSYDTTIRVWDLQRPRHQIPLEGHSGKVFAVELDASGSRALTASHDGTARVWDGRDGTSLAILDGGERDVVYHATFSPDAAFAALGRQSGAVELWQLTGGERRVLRGHEGPVWQVSFDPAGERLASASFDETARIWSVASGEELVVLRGHGDKLTGVDFAPDGERVVTASHDGSVRVWDASSGSLLRTLRGHEGKISALVRSPDGQTLATASDDGSARLWPAEGLGEPLMLAGHDKAVWSIAFDADGHRVVTASFDGDARVWSVADGRLLETLSGHADAVWDARFVGEDRVITGSNDNTLRLWSLGTEALPIVLSGHGSGITRLSVTPDGSRVVSASSDGTAKLWYLGRLSADPLSLHQRLWAVTLYCLSVEQRMRELGEDRREAADNFARCEAREPR
jgi:WD40 repeat protein/predicted Ser/Thr protein kinase